ncbi:nit protein 1 [Tremella mesenterica]|uniref:Nit protein 1 n=1 Tax=Tremella mesenterica TaxID=5217 RepID=A0A4Q1BRQ7_TREME|nr:nit protein 1 [Tremella mesenterica]
MPKVAVCQITSTNDPEHNLRISSNLVRKAVAAGAQACFLPEAADFITSSIEECHFLSPPLSKHPYTLGLRSLAKELGVIISAGVHETPESDEEDTEPPGSLKVYNTHVLIGPQGDLLARYRKLHMYDVELTQPSLADGTPQPPKIFGESERVRKGMEIVPPVDLGSIGKLGLQICYDMRFPEDAIILRRMGADVLTFPSAFAIKTGRDHWCKGIAIQNQTYVLSAAQWGAHNPQRSSWGESVAFDPWGKPLGRLRSLDETPAGTQEDVEALYKQSGEFFLCDINLDVVNSTRTQIPLAIQKRTDVYGVVGESLPTRKPGV